MISQQQTKLVHVVACVDVKTGKGEFLYVNPTTAAAAAGQPAAAGAVPRGAGQPPGKGFELVVEAADGKELQLLKPSVLLPSDQKKPKVGLIDQSIPHFEGMARLVLLYDGKVVDTFEGGSPQPPRTAPAAAIHGVALGVAPPGTSDKRPMSLDTPVQPEPGVSYTIQVRPSGEQAWQTIAVGRKTPEVVIDRNQFPGAQRATVRVLRSTGFEDRVIAEDEMDLAFKQ